MKKQSDGTLKEWLAPVIIDLDHCADSVEASIGPTADLSQSTS